MLPTVALVGRPNVGKSTLFNVLTRSRAALVHDEPGVTRDAHVGLCRWQADCHFAVVDTGGITEDKDALAQVISQQARGVAAAADVLAFIVDAREGKTPLDDDILGWLRRLSTPIVLVINKTDGLDPEQALAEFAEFGLDACWVISAAHRRGIDALIVGLLKHLVVHDGVMAHSPTQGLRVACVGRPNVGKSTLINRLLGEQRVIASEIPGTTRDAIALELSREGQDYLWIDTAGLRRRARVDGAVETLSAIKTLQAIEQCQIAVLLLDAETGVTDQDAHVLAAILDAQRGLVVALNKWDGLSRYQREQALSSLSRKLSFIPWVEIVKISALQGSGFKELFHAIGRAHASASRVIATSALNRALHLACQHHPPPSSGGHVSKLRYMHGAGIQPPTWIIHGTRLKSLPSSYLRYLENFFRAHFALVGTPVRLVLREGENPYAGKTNVLTDRQRRRRQRLLRHVKRK